MESCASISLRHIFKRRSSDEHFTDTDVLSIGKVNGRVLMWQAAANEVMGVAGVFVFCFFGSLSVTTALTDFKSDGAVTLIYYSCVRFLPP